MVHPFFLPQISDQTRLSKKMYQCLSPLLTWNWDEQPTFWLSVKNTQRMERQKFISYDIREQLSAPHNATDILLHQLFLSFHLFRENRPISFQIRERYSDSAHLSPTPHHPSCIKKVKFLFLIQILIHKLHLDTVHLQYITYFFSGAVHHGQLRNTSWQPATPSNSLHTRDVPVPAVKGLWRADLPQVHPEGLPRHRNSAQGQRPHWSSTWTWSWRRHLLRDFRTDKPTQSCSQRRPHSEIQQGDI